MNKTTINVFVSSDTGGGGCLMSPAPGKNKIMSRSWLVLNQLKQNRTKR